MRYFWITIRHKWFVLLAARKVGLSLWRVLLHDLSKFTLAELPHYDRQFFGDKGDPEGFAKAWLHHQNCNPHHWGHYILGVGIVISYNSAAESKELVRKETSLGKVDTISNPLEIVGIVESPTSAFGDRVIDRRVPSRYQQVSGDGATISLRFKFIEKHAPKGQVVTSRSVPNDCSPMQETVLSTAWQAFCSANYAKSSSTQTSTSRLVAFSLRFSSFLDSLRLQHRRSFSRLNMKSFQLLLPGSSQPSSAKPHIVGLTLNGMATSAKNFHEHCRSIGGIPLAENLLFLLCPGLRLSHNDPPGNDCTTKTQYVKRKKQYWLLPGIKLVEMPEVYVREMIADWMGASRAYKGTWKMDDWLDKNLDKMRLHPATKKLVLEILG